MEIRVLRYFLEIAREGSMTAAAEVLHVSQPALSKHMKELEEELGKKLFRRGSRSVSLTDRGNFTAPPGRGYPRHGGQNDGGIPRH